MKYYYDIRIEDSFENARKRVTEALSKEGFGVLTEIDVRDTFRKKLDVDFHDYVILGACNPHFAYQAFQTENKIGTMLPCNVIVRDSGNGVIEVAAIDPTEAMKAVENSDLAKLAEEVRDSLARALDSIQ